MSLMVTLPDGFQYVILSLLSTIYLLAYQVNRVTTYRRRAAIKYPQAYAEKAEQEKSSAAMKFNCAQRAHQNTLEYLPLVYTTTVITGLKYPHFAASICALFVIGRIAYTRGYVTGDPAKRVNHLHSMSAVGLMGQLLVATYVAVGMACPELLLQVQSQFKGAHIVIMDVVVFTIG